MPNERYEPEPEEGATAEGTPYRETPGEARRSVVIGTRPAALCHACGAVVVTTPINPTGFWPATPDLPPDPCPHCTAHDWRMVVVHGLLVVIPPGEVDGEGA